MPAPRPPPPATTGLRLLLLDEHAAYRRELAAWLRRQPGIAEVAEADDGAAAQTLLAAAAPPDLLLLALPLQAGRGLALAAALHARWPQLRLLALSLHEPAPFEPALRAAGALGHWRQDDAPAGLLSAIRQAAAGHGVWPPLR